MKAAALLSENRLEIGEWPMPECPEGGVLVRVKACGICSSDVKMVTKGHRALVYPRVLGHEIAGVVARSRTGRYKEGDRVQVAPGLRCGMCAQCRAGADNRCENREILGFTRDGGFAHYVSVPLEGNMLGALNPLPKNVTYEHATLAEPIACCINAQNKVNVKRGDSVLIIGAGPLGLLHCFVSAHRGADKILVSEVNGSRRKAAVESGADHAFDPKNGDLFEMVMGATNGKGVSVIIFACGQIGLDETFIKMLSPGGSVSIFSGLPPHLSRVQVDSNLIHYGEIAITGAYGCTARHNWEAIELISSATPVLGEIITNRVGLDNIKEGLENVNLKMSLKCIVEV
jgi:L-iditol 2-dehydrogenase